MFLFSMNDLVVVGRRLAAFGKWGAGGAGGGPVDGVW
jgi:hypothetical protein